MCSCGDSRDKWELLAFDGFYQRKKRGRGRSFWEKLSKVLQGQCGGRDFYFGVMGLVAEGVIKGALMLICRGG